MDEVKKKVKEEYLEDIVALTEFAANRFKKSCDDNSKPYELRVGIRGGGCSGFEYVFAPKDKDIAGDNVFEQYGVRIYVDSKSAEIIKGTIIDANVLAIAGQEYQFYNEKAKSTCGCGLSFS